MPKLCILFLVTFQYIANAVNFTVEQVGNEFYTGNPMFHFAVNGTENEELQLLYNTPNENSTTDTFQLDSVTVGSDFDVTVNIENTGPSIIFILQSSNNSQILYQADAIQIVKGGTFGKVSGMFSDPCRSRTCDSKLYLPWALNLGTENVTLLSSVEYLNQIAPVSGIYFEARCYTPTKLDCVNNSIIMTNFSDTPNNTFIENLSNGQSYKLFAIPLFFDLTKTWSAPASYNGDIFIPADPTIAEFGDIQLLDDQKRKLPLSPPFQADVFNYTASNVTTLLFAVSVVRSPNAPRVSFVGCYFVTNTSYCNEFERRDGFLVVEHIAPEMQFKLTTISEEGSNNVTYNIFVDIDESIFSEGPEAPSPTHFLTTRNRNNNALAIGFGIVGVVAVIIVAYSCWRVKKRSQDVNALEYRLLEK